MKDISSTLHLPISDLDQVVDAVGGRWERLRGKRLLLTGGTGFIGKWLLATFFHANQRYSLGAKVIAISRRPELFCNEYPELAEKDEIHWLKGDVRALAHEAANGCSYAIHAATDVVTSTSPTEILETCTTGTRRVLDAMAANAVASRVLLLSSGAVYGRTPPEVTAIPESWAGAPDPLLPASVYGEGKRVSELLCAMAAAANPNIQVSIARCFAFVGPHLPLDKHFAVGNFIRAALSGEDIHIQGDGTPIRSYLYAADLAHWLWVLLFDGPNARVYNVGGIESISIGALAHRVNRVLDGTGKVLIAKTPPLGVRPQSYVPSIDRILNELTLKPSIELDEAILRTARWASPTV